MPDTLIANILYVCFILAIVWYILPLVKTEAKPWLIITEVGDCKRLTQAEYESFTPEKGDSAVFSEEGVLSVYKCVEKGKFELV